MISACPSLMCSYRVMLKGLALQKIVVDFFVYMFCFMFVQGLNLWLDLRKGLCMKSFELCICLQQI